MDEGPLQVWVRALDGDPVPAEILWLDADLARLKVPTGLALEPTTEGLLGLVERATGSSVVVPVVVGWPEDDGPHQLCDLFFIDGTMVAEEDTRTPRRRASRVVPAPGEVVAQVQSHRPGRLGWVPIDVLDLSVGGVAVEIEVGHEPTMPFTAGELRLALPGEAPQVVAALVQNRTRFSRERVRYGLAFDPARSSAFDETIAALGRWVARKRAAFAALVGGQAASGT